MKLKYYLRGLGIGIAVTTLIMSRILKTEELTDDQIKLRAAELGMVEEIVLADLPEAAVEKEEQEFQDKSKEEKKKETFEYTAGEAEIIEMKGEVDINPDKGVSVSEAVEDESNTYMPQEVGKDQMEIIQESEDVNGEMVEKYVIISIEPGNGSETVSRMLYNAGLVKSAVQFNRFLVNNGYDTNLVVGNHEIPEGVSEEELVKILCGME